MKDPFVMYAESPLNPLSIGRQRSEAGLAYEKHHFLFRGRDGERHVQIFDYAGGFSRGPAVRESELGRRIVDELGLENLPQPTLHFTLLYDARMSPCGGHVPAAVRELVEAYPGELYLCFAASTLPGRNTGPGSLIERVLGAPWGKPAEPATVPLTGAARTRALSALGCEGWTDLYLLAAPSERILKRASNDSSRDDVLHQMTGGAKYVRFDQFSELVRECDWVLTTHGRLSGRVPVCLYSTRDLRGPLRELAQRTEEQLVEVHDFKRLPGYDEAKKDVHRVSDAVGEQAARSAASISLVGTEVTGLDELLDNPNLRELDVTGIPWLDTTVVAQLTELESLSMDQIKVDGFDFLVLLQRLQHLRLSRAPFRGLSELGRLTQLRSLRLHSGYPDYLHSIDFVRSMLSLETLEIDASALSVEPLAGRPSLRNLTLFATVVKDIDALAALGLESLTLSSASVSDLGPLRGMETLRVLHVVSTPVSDLAPLRGLIALRELNLLGTQVTDITPIAGLCALEELSLQYLQLEDYRPVASLSSLTKLWLRDTSIEDLTPISALPRLRHLNLGGTRVTDLTPLRGITTLEVLHVDDTPVVDFSPLVDLPRLRELKVSKGRLRADEREELMRRGCVIEERDV